MPEPFNLYRLFRKIRIGVSDSLPTEFSIGPACQPLRPAASTIEMTVDLASTSFPHTKTSPSRGSFDSSAVAATFWKAETSRTFWPNFS